MAPPAPPEGKRGRGRPRKDPSERKTKPPTGRPRGRPKGSGGVKKVTATPASPAVVTTTRSGRQSGKPRGRPPKEPSERKTPVKVPGRGRGRPRKNPPPVDEDAPGERGAPTTVAMSTLAIAQNTSTGPANGGNTRSRQSAAAAAASAVEDVTNGEEAGNIDADEDDDDAEMDEQDASEEDARPGEWDTGSQGNADGWLWRTNMWNAYLALT